MYQAIFCGGGQFVGSESSPLVLIVQGLVQSRRLSITRLLGQSRMLSLVQGVASSPGGWSIAIVFFNYSSPPPGYGPCCL